MNGFFLVSQKLYCKNLQWKYIKNESGKSYSGNKKQKTTFPVISRFEAHLV